MSDQQSCQPEITREKCEEIVDETASILGDMGSLISGPMGLLISLIATFLSAVTFAIAFYALCIETGLLQKGIITGIVACLFTIIIAVVTYFIVSRKLQRMGLRVAETARDTLVKILVNRKSLLKQCLTKECTHGDQEFLCEDIIILLKAIENIEKLLN